MTIDYGDGLGLRTLRNQIRIDPANAALRFSDRGDSGSVIMNDNREVIGLLFGGATDGSMTFANPIADVLSELNVTMLTEGLTLPPTRTIVCRPSLTCPPSQLICPTRGIACVPTLASCPSRITCPSLGCPATNLICPTRACPTRVCPTISGCPTRACPLVRRLPIARLRLRTPHSRWHPRWHGGRIRLRRA
ncbi:MAG: hypothetical protein IPM11_00305 [Micropruina sp.]|nr:hypothetical protein [Micropruina sp.]